MAVSQLLQFKRIGRLSKSIFEVTYNEIKDLDIDSWFSPISRANASRLYSMLWSWRATGSSLNIELMFNGHDQALTQRVLELICGNEFAEQSVLTLLDYEAPQQVEEPAYPVGR